MSKRIGGIIRDILLGRIGRRRSADSPTGLATGDRRACERFEFSAYVPFRIPGARAEQPDEKVCLRDLSASGVGLTHTRHIPPGTDLILFLSLDNDLGGDCDAASDSTAADVPAREVVCRVTRCVESAPGVFVMGAVFLHCLAADEPAEDAAAAQRLTEAEIRRIREHILDD